MTLKIGSLFSGIGGLDLAVEEFFDAETAWHCEWEPEPSKVLAARWPGVPNLHDVTKVDWAAVEPVDIMCGGFPCQDVSLAGRRRGMKEGTRSGLWSEFARAIDIVKPKVVVVENVRGLLTAQASGGAAHVECRVCGWTDGRRGVDRDVLAAEGSDLDPVLPGPLDSGDDRASVAAAEGVREPVGRSHRDGARGDGQMGAIVGVEPVREELDSIPLGDRAAHADQVRGSEPGARLRDAEGRTAETPEREPGVDSRTRELGGDGEIEGARVELARPCPECGGELVERPGGDVEPCPWCMGDGADEYHLRALDAVLADLSDLGFDAEWGGLRAADVGAPHGRFRFFLLAYARGVRLESWRDTVAGEEAAGGASAVARGRADAPLTLLPTPSAASPDESESIEEWQARRERVKESTGNGNGFGMPLGVAVRLLPTPTVGNATGGNARRGGDRGDEALLPGIARDATAGRLLPTPMVGSTNPAAHGQISGDVRKKMSEAVANWGPYEPAVRLWESLTRPAPAPTIPDGKNGNHRLAAVFPEWMMGYPAGWVTDVIGRNAAIKACGNGVVPQQAYAALTILWGRVLEAWKEAA